MDSFLWYGVQFAKLIQKKILISENRWHIKEVPYCCLKRQIQKDNS